MGQINTRDLVLLGAATQTTSGAGNDMVVPQAWQAAILTVNISSVTGTTPTLNVFLQRKLAQAAAADLSGNFPTGTAIYDDLLAFSTLTTTGNQIGPVISGGFAPAAAATANLATGVDYLQKDAALTASSYRIGPLGGLWRIKWVVGGTTPNFNFSVVAHLVPYST